MARERAARARARAFMVMGWGRWKGLRSGVKGT